MVGLTGQSLPVHRVCEFLHASVTILPDFGDDHALSSRNSGGEVVFEASRTRTAENLGLQNEMLTWKTSQLEPVKNGKQEVSGRPTGRQSSRLTINPVGVEKLGSKTRFPSGEFLPVRVFLALHGGSYHGVRP